MSNKRLLRLFMAVSIFLTGALPVLAEQNAEKAESPFRVNLKIDLPVIAISTLTAVSVRYLEGSLPRNHISYLDSSRVNKMDRSVIGYHYPGWNVASHVGTILIPVATLSLSLIELPRFGWNGVIEDFLIAGEALSASAMLNQIVAGAMPRPRPYMYRVSSWYRQSRHSSWDWRSFYSGHAGSCFAVTTAFSYIFMMRYPESKLIPLVWVVSMVSSSMVAIARPLAGEHFWSDTIIGSVFGVAWGILIPVLHERQPVRKEGDVKVSLSGNALSLTCFF